MIHMAYPWVLICIILPFLVRRCLAKSKPTTEAALKVPFYQALNQTFASQNKHTSAEGLSNWKYLLGLIWVLLVISGSGIQWEGKPLSLPQTGRDLLLAIDLSGSMQTPDMLVNAKAETRIDIVKKVASEFINQRRGDRLGLILFGSRAYLQTPLTFDRQTVSQLLNDATIGIAGQQTAMGDAIGLAVKQLMDYPSSSKALILLTDGGNNSGVIDPQEAAKLAQQEHIKIYTIGLGAKQMTVQTLFGSQVINPSSDLDIAGLQQIASATGGQFFRAEDGASLQNIYAQINQLEPIKSATVTVRPVTPLYPWTLGLALSLSLLFCFGQQLLLSIDRRK